MNPHTCLLALVVLFGTPALAADAGGDAAQPPENAQPTHIAAATAATENAPSDDANSAKVAGSPESEPSGAETAPATPASVAPASLVTPGGEGTQESRDPAAAASTTTVADTKEASASPAASEAGPASVSVPASAAAQSTVSPHATAPAASRPAEPTPSTALPPATDALESRADLLAARVSLMEQLWLAQRDREISLYRDTIRTVTIFGGAFAGLCMIGLLAAAFLNYRALIAVQNVYSRTQGANASGGSGATNGLLPGPAAGDGTAVPGIERVQASGQRFQSRMTGLEQRLAELEHLAGRDSVPAAIGDDPENTGLDVATVAEPVLPPPPRPVIPRALILVHKAQTQSNLGKLSDALATLDEAVALDAEKAEVHLARGQVLEKLGRLGDALHAYDAAVEVDEQNTSALLLKAGVLNRQERFSEALACYERALEVHRASV